MKKQILAAFLLSLLITLPASSQDTDSKSGSSNFLIPFLETAFFGELRWRPDWPDYIPPDSFLVLGKKQPAVIELSNDDISFALRRDSEGRLFEFPYFNADEYAKVNAEYAATGALKEMKIAFSSGKVWNITFSAGFLPYSDMSPGGSFPPLQVSSDEGNFFVFIFETPSFLTETWYDDGGNMTLFCKASVNFIEKKWRVTSLQIHEKEEVSFIDYFFDSYGNISEIRSNDTTFSALFVENRPTSWQRPELQYNLHWDTQAALTIVKATGESDELGVEYRYEYETDGGGIWVKRQETAIKSSFNLLVPQPSFSRGVWNRRVVYGD